MVKTPVDGMLFPGDGPAELFVKLPASDINTAIADHLKMFFRDMPVGRRIEGDANSRLFFQTPEK